MYSFIICFLVLVASYFVYGKVVEKAAGVDETRQTRHIDYRMALTTYQCPRLRISWFIF